MENLMFLLVIAVVVISIFYLIMKEDGDDSPDTVLIERDILLRDIQSLMKGYKLVISKQYGGFDKYCLKINKRVKEIQAETDSNDIASVKALNEKLAGIKKDVDEYIKYRATFFAKII